VRGPARKRRCEDCGGQARHWATIIGRAGDSPEDYRPLCYKCHRAYDKIAERMRSKTHCRNGHEYTEATTYWRKSHTGRIGRVCKTCEQARWHRYKADQRYGDYYRTWRAIHRHS
jgi:hypothetical protein